MWILSCYLALAALDRVVLIVPPYSLFDCFTGFRRVSARSIEALYVVFA